MVILRTGTENILFAVIPEIVPFSFGDSAINQGDFAQLTCVIRRGDKPLSITWSLKGDVISSDPLLTTTMLGQQTSILIISSVDYQHSGQYTCRAENPAGISTYSTELLVNGNSLEWHLKYSVAEPPEIVPFSFGRDVVNQGEFAQLSCVIFRGDSPLSITWSLKGDIISSDPVMTTTMIGQQTSILIISAVDYQHSGEYTCRAENPAGITTYSAELLVNGNYWNWHWKCLVAEPPEIVPFSFGKEVVNQGEFAQLTCVVSRGDKPLSITWSLKGDIISSDPVMTTTMIGQQTSILIISSVDYQHSGEYTCRAENPAGQATYSTDLLVNGTTKRTGTGNITLKFISSFPVKTLMT